MLSRPSSSKKTTESGPGNAASLDDVSSWDSSLGSISLGNHFAELQAIEKVEDAETFASLNLSEKHLVLLVHSGSRGLGQAILRDTRPELGSGIEEGSAAFETYLARDNHAVEWGRANRALIAHRVLSACGKRQDQDLPDTLEEVLDICHNNVEPLDNAEAEPDQAASASTSGRQWIYRKGAALSN